MTELSFPDLKLQITDFSEIQKRLSGYGVALERWEANFSLKNDDDQATILKAYSHELEPFMKKHGYTTSDVINVHSETPNVEQVRQKFLKEHVHSENEIRFFVEGEGIFWFHFDDDVTARLRCVKGDFLAVPAGYRHWFDLAPKYFVKAIRIFSNQEGWVAQYTESGFEQKYTGV